ncbi:hypothetical protein VTI28DRAFT_7365 [Corynascus sepedonium]
MSADDSDTYAPKSPDLSSFYSGPTPPAEPAEPQLFLSQQSKPNFSHLQSSSGHHFTNSRPQQHQPEAGLGQKYGVPSLVQTSTQTRHSSDPNASQTPGFGVGGVGHSSTTQREYYPPRAASYPVAGYSHFGSGYAATQAPPTQQQAPFYQPQFRGSLQYQHEQSCQTPHEVIAAQAQVSQPNDYRVPASAHDPTFDQTSAMPPRRAAAAAAAAAVAAQTASDAAGGGSLSPSAAPVPSAPAAAPPFESVTVKTKFPTARIKRIMQADEEVGKVAQQTPIAVGKALELFMVALVTKSAEVARQRNSKRVSAQMLKQVVESDDQWDFLRDIVGKVEGEEKGGKGGSQSQGGRVKAENSETDEEMGGADAAAGAKKKRGGGRKKKV